MSLLWIEAARTAREGVVEHLPVASFIDPTYRSAMAPDRPKMADLLHKLHGDGGYDPQRHGMLQAHFDAEGTLRRLRLPANHQVAGFGEMAPTALAHALEHLGHEHVPVMVTRDRPAPTRETNPTRARVFYHGTTAEGDLDRILPASQSGASVIYQHQTDPDYAYATTSKDDAWTWAQKAWDNTGGRPRVFKVRRRGPVEPDEPYDRAGNSRSVSDSDVRSRHGFDVIGEEPMPHHMRHMYEDEG